MTFLIEVNIISKHFIVELFHCRIVELFHCRIAELIHCRIVELFYCRIVELFYCRIVSLPNYLVSLDVLIIFEIIFLIGSKSVSR